MEQRAGRRGSAALVKDAEAARRSGPCVAGSGEAATEERGINIF